MEQFCNYIYMYKNTQMYDINVHIVDFTVLEKGENFNLFYNY